MNNIMKYQGRAIVSFVKDKKILSRHILHNSGTDLMQKLFAFSVTGQIVNKEYQKELLPNKLDIVDLSGSTLLDAIQPKFTSIAPKEVDSEDDKYIKWVGAFTAAVSYSPYLESQQGKIILQMLSESGNILADIHLDNNIFNGRIGPGVTSYIQWEIGIATNQNQVIKDPGLAYTRNFIEKEMK